VLPGESRNKGQQQMTADVDPDPLTTIEDANHLESHGLVLRPVQVLLPASVDMNYSDAGTAATASIQHNDTRQQGLLLLSLPPM
jgi:hypothetical protein